MRKSLESRNRLQGMLLLRTAASLRRAQVGTCEVPWNALSSGSALSRRLRSSVCLWVSTFAPASLQQSLTLYLVYGLRWKNSFYCLEKQVKPHFSVAFLWTHFHSTRLHIKEGEIREPGDHLVFVLFVVSSLALFALCDFRTCGVEHSMLHFLC